MARAEASRLEVSGMSDSRKRVRVHFLLLSFLCGVLALCSFIYVLYTGITGVANHMLVADMPGSQTLELTEVGSYTIFHEWTREYPSTVEVGSDRDAEAMGLALVGPDGGPVQLSVTNESSHYQIGSREGYSLYSFQIEKAGEYSLTGSYESDSKARVTFTIVHNFMGKILTVVGMCFLCILLPAVPGVLFLVLGLKPLFQESRTGPEGQFVNKM